MIGIYIVAFPRYIDPGNRGELVPRIVFGEDPGGVPQKLQIGLTVAAEAVPAAAPLFSSAEVWD